MKRTRLAWIAGITVLLVVGLGCGLSIPVGRSVIDSAATSVAATVNALAATAGTLLTEVPKDVIATEAPSDALPTLSPIDSLPPLRVSFVSPDGNLYTWADGTGSPQLLASDGDICCSYISSDGSMIAFTRYGSDDSFISLDVINSDGTGRFTLLDSGSISAFPLIEYAIGAEPGQIRWVPGSHKLAMNLHMLFEGPGLAFSDTIYLIDAETGVINPLLTTGSSSHQFTYSPDGQKIAVSLPTQMDMYAADGSLIASSIMTYDFVNTASEYAWVASPVWSADSYTLLAGVPPANPFEEVPNNSRIILASVDGSTSIELFSGQIPFMEARNIAFSSDFTKYLYFTRFGASEDNMFSLNIGYFDGSAPFVYASDQFMYAPVWSPDNSHFFYTVGAGNTQYPYIGQIGMAPTAVTDFTNANSTYWVDDNRYITVSNNAGVSRLLLGTIGAPTGLIFDAGSPSANFLTYSVNR